MVEDGTAIDFSTFLEEVPPLVKRLVSVQFEVLQYGREVIRLPRLSLYCADDSCSGIRFHDSKTQLGIPEGDSAIDQLFAYRCRNCKSAARVYAVPTSDSGLSRELVHAMKIGQYPRFGEPRPDIVTVVLEDEIKYFKYGYRAETDGLGIGAFAYYRRFVESHKDKIIAEIRKVAVMQGLDAAIVEGLDRAAKKREFAAAVNEIKDAIPDGLKMNGANPLTLLHNALSAGLHNDDDVSCLEIAQDIRTVLTALAERTAELLKAGSALSAAVTRLNQRNAGQRPKL